MIDLERCKTDEAYRLIARDQLLGSFELFVSHFFYWTYKKEFHWSSHHLIMTDFLVRLHRGEFVEHYNKCVINIPPRYSKTELVIKMFPSWCYAINLQCNFMHLSYSDDLAVDNGDTVREIIKSDAFKLIFDDVSIKTNKDTKKRWAIKDGGEFYSTAAGGRVIGFGAGDVQAVEMPPDGNYVFSGGIFIDDPLKADEAHSEALREKVNRRLDETIKSRCNSSYTPIVVIMQRLHEDDFTATALNDTEFDWKHLCLPALDENDNALWPDKHTADRLKAMRKKNAYVFAGQYQQTPTPVGGGLFKDSWWRYYSKLPPKVDYLFIAGDTALKAKKVHDYSVFICFAVAEGRLYVLDMVRGKWEAPELEIHYCAFWNKWKVNKPKPRCSYIEDKASGTGLMQKMQRIAHSPIRPIQRNIDKVTRAHDTTPYVESGYVLLPMSAPWLSDFLDEMSKFTALMTHKNDDIADVLFDGVQIAFNSRKKSMFDVV